MDTQEKDFGYEGWKVQAPSYRFDIEDECDLCLLYTSPSPRD